MKLICKLCGKEFEPHKFATSATKYCPDCRAKAYLQVQRDWHRAYASEINRRKRERAKREMEMLR